VLRSRLGIDRMRVNISTIMPKQLLSLVASNGGAGAGGLQSMFGIISFHCFASFLLSFVTLLLVVATSTKGMTHVFQ
jgi:hypothetical protein